MIFISKRPNAPHSAYLLVGRFCYLCRVVVADVGVEGRDQHERVADVVLDTLPVWLHAVDAKLPERTARVCIIDYGL